ncbi:Phenolic glucoside malonyltransferase 2 [Raphanus sativus]|uniref:Phenolic glucoside malonyltransferase 2 n=1 Tax=Raphanus sativus TaxID=3726 RepID=A0A6J0KZU1_RAPSA|nr:phenolic glucoside malonyltransferase 2 [Raphanus sativus]KAJ4874748.1 Phenolic glucoside malonyltransferase 2 [Raphanus sativus]
MTIQVVEVSRVTPAHDSDSANSLALPLTFFDIPWLVISPVKRVFFYSLTESESTREHFHSSILPKLKLSLSLALRSYLPLSGRIISDPKPTIIVSPNDAVSLTVAETDSDFSLLSGFGQRPAWELHTLIPELPLSDDDSSATVLSLQITLFPGQGFSIGVTAHHAVLDGKTSTMFVKAWAHFCKHENVVVLPETLIPSLDRSLVKDPTGLLHEQMIKLVRSLTDDGKIIASRNLSSSPAWERGDDGVFSTLVLSRGDVERLRERVKNESGQSQSQLLHLSTLVVAYAYVWTCLVRAQGGDAERHVSLLFVADFRERLDPPLPATYFGNCMFPAGCFDGKTAGDFAGEGGFVAAVEILSGLVKGLRSRKIETIAEEFKIGFDCVGVTSQLGSLSGSNRLGVYEADFGWGRPVKVDVVSIERNTISMAERRDESGGIELGLCMKKAELDVVLALFNSGLQN